jgi:type III secretory pathway component EscS
MRTKEIAKFVRRLAIRVIIFTFVMIVVAAVWQSVSTIISNYIAMTQMQNDDLAFVIMNVYNRVKPIGVGIYGLIILWFVYTLGRDTYKFVKKNNNNIEKEN